MTLHYDRQEPAPPPATRITAGAEMSTPSYFCRVEINRGAGRPYSVSIGKANGRFWPNPLSTDELKEAIEMLEAALTEGER